MNCRSALHNSHYGVPLVDWSRHSSNEKLTRSCKKRYFTSTSATHSQNISSLEDELGRVLFCLLLSKYPLTMESDDEEEELNVAEEFLRHSALRRAAERPTLLGHLQQWIPRQTIVYIQYCLLRIPFLLLYDYIFTEQFSQCIDGFLKYSIDVIDQEKHFLFLPISYILHSYLFQALIEVNVLFSIPILGKTRHYHARWLYTTSRSLCF